MSEVGKPFADFNLRFTRKSRHSLFQNETRATPYLSSERERRERNRQDGRERERGEIEGGERDLP